MKTTTAAAAFILAAVLTSVAIPASAAQFPACAATQLHLTLGHERANTGHVSYVVTAANRGPACVLSGWPKLGLLDDRRNPLPEVTATTGKAHSVLVLGGLHAQFGLSYGSDGMTGERAAYLKVGGNVVAFPGGPALVYGGQLTVTSWVLPARQ